MTGRVTPPAPTLAVAGLLPHPAKRARGSDRTRTAPARLQCVHERRRIPLDRDDVLRYNFIKEHSSLGRKTPTMAAGITDHAFKVRDMIFAGDQIVQAAA